MPKQNVRNGRIGKILRQERAMNPNDEPRQKWDSTNREWMAIAQPDGHEEDFEAIESILEDERVKL